MKTALYYETSAHVKGGVFKAHDKEGFERAIRRFPDGEYVLRVELANKKRTNAQNKFWHAVVIPLFADHCGYDEAEMKEALSLKLIPKEIVDMDTGEVRVIPGRTSALTVKEFNDLIERAQRLGAEMEIYIPDPREVAA